MQAVILAAGMGSRLGALTTDRPKALVQVAGRELILHTLDFLDHQAISERIVVTGFKSWHLDAFLKEHRPDVKTVHNPDFADGSIRTIETALPLISGDFLVMNTDHIYPRRMIKCVLEHGRGLTAVCDFDRKLGTDDMKVKLTDAGKLRYIRKTLDDFDGGYIGMTICKSGFLADYRRGVKKARKTEGDSASVECALGILAGGDKPVNICDASGIGWLEVDTQDDLALAEKAINNNPDLLL